METIDNKILLSEAASASLIFAAVSGAYVFLGPVLSNTAAAWVYQLFALAKLVGLIWLMRFLMGKMRKNYDIGRVQIRRYGTWIALLSAILTAACSYICIEYAFPDFYKETLDEVWKTMGSMMDDNSRGVIEYYENNLAMISMASNLIWCFLYGWVLSCILAPRVAPANNIFDDFEDDE